MSAPDAPSVRNELARYALAGAGLLVLALAQVTPFPLPGELWFLYGRDTVAHDIPVHLWIWAQMADDPGALPLWMPGLQGGLPVLGAFLWTPFAPTVWLHALLPFALAQQLQFVLAFAWGGIGTLWLIRGMGLRWGAALVAAVAFALCGHVVTLVHAGHLQKILALAWLPWFAGGMVRCFDVARAEADRLRGLAVAGLALGFAFLSGHPQVAYMMLMLAGLRGAAMVLPRVFRVAAWAELVLILTAIAVLGGLVGAAQLLPGMEMSAWSNRAQGVAFAEATESSYPPEEILEFAFPRHRGDSVATGANDYRGRWGERLVSDYASILVIVLAVLALLISGRLRESLFWWVVVLVFLVIGLGAHTPLYQVFYDWVPGWRSFRSPGTFYAPVALALPVLAALAADGLTSGNVRQRGTRLMLASLGFIVAGAGVLVLAFGMPGGEQAAAGGLKSAAFWRSGVFLVLGSIIVPMTPIRVGKLRENQLVLLLLATAIAVDLGFANRAFLVAHPWSGYEAYRTPDAVDLRALREVPHPPVRVSEINREQSLRPLLVERDALLGYHPISFRAFSDFLDATGFDSLEWRAHWGIGHAILPPGLAPPDTIETVGRPSESGQLLVRYPDDASAWQWRGAVNESWRPLAPESVVWRPNHIEAVVDMPRAGDWGLVATESPGWRVSVNDERPRRVREVALRRVVRLPAGTSTVRWVYAPASVRRGVLLSAIGLMGVGLLVSVSWPRRREE